MTAFIKRQLKLYEESEEILNRVSNLDLIRSVTPDDQLKYILNKRGPSSPKTAALRWSLDCGLGMHRTYDCTYLKSEYKEPSISLINHSLTIHPDTDDFLNQFVTRLKPLTATDDLAFKPLANTLDIQTSRLWLARPKYHHSEDFPDRKLKIIIMRLSIHQGLIMLEGLHNTLYS